MIVGIDPGVAIIGYAFVREQRGILTLIACDVIRTPSHTPLEDRLLSIYQQIQTLLALHNPNEAAMETLFFGKNKKTAMQVGHARGVLMLALSQYGLPLAEYGPSEVKMALTGSGSAKKPQVGEMVRTLLKLPVIPKPDDAADAAAIAICHAHIATWRSQ
ncbi:MAG: crossover junction endodeoxyribonuclease RuvC [Ktedonobacteraceae bacterium]|nr:crossover junction endodeoxyribonuclease RuvC [Ktedonobacteraceae bacterium]